MKYNQEMHSCCDESRPAWPASRGNLFLMAGTAEVVLQKLCPWMKRDVGRIEGRATIHPGLEQMCCRGG